MPGYWHRLNAAHASLGDQLRGKVVHGVITHDAWCAIYRGGECNCVPDISLHPDGGGDVIVVDEARADQKGCRIVKEGEPSK